MKINEINAHKEEIKKSISLMKSSLEAVDRLYDLQTKVNEALLMLNDLDTKNSNEVEECVYYIKELLKY